MVQGGRLDVIPKVWDEKTWFQDWSSGWRVEVHSVGAGSTKYSLRKTWKICPGAQYMTFPKYWPPILGELVSRNDTKYAV